MHQWRVTQTFTALLAKQNHAKCQDWTMTQDWDFSDYRSLTPDSISQSSRDSLSLLSCVMSFLILPPSHRNVDLMGSLLMSSQPPTWSRTIIQQVLWETHFSDTLPTSSQENFPHVQPECTKPHFIAVWCCFTIFPKREEFGSIVSVTASRVSAGSCACWLWLWNACLFSLSLILNPKGNQDNIVILILNSCLLKVGALSLEYS